MFDLLRARGRAARSAGHRQEPHGLWLIGAGVAIVVLCATTVLTIVNVGGGPQRWDSAGAARAGDTLPSIGITLPPTPGSVASTPARPGASSSGTVPPTASPATKRPATGVPAPPPGFTTTFADVFDGKAGTGLNLQAYKHNLGTGTFGTGEIETMTDSVANVFHDGAGHLVLRAVHSGADPAKGWTSGRFETQGAAFGAAANGVVRIQASVQQPDVAAANGAGYWSAFWLIGAGLRAGGTWPGVGEIDIMQAINGRNSLFGVLHCGVNPGGPCNEPVGVSSGERPCPGCQTGFHTFVVEIDRATVPNRIRWFLDGRNYFTLDQTNVDATAWTNAVDHPFAIVFSLAIGGGFPAAFGGGPNAATISGGAMKIDYLAVYNKP